MRFLRRNSSEEAGSAERGTGGTVDAIEVDGIDDDASRSSAYTPPKGRPTPKQSESAGKRRGPVAPPPKTTREAIRRNRELKKTNPVSKEERRAATRERRERMLAGDERYLLPRDRGPVRAYVRDLVDSRRNVLGLFMPLALVVFATLLIPIPAIQQYATLLTTVMLLGMLLEGFLNGRRVARAARIRYPDEHIRGAALGWYAFVRASQLRRLRVPKPRIKPGDRIP